MSYIINPGNLKHRIDFYSNEFVRDEEGFKTATTVKILSTKCAITSNSIIDNKRSGDDALDTFNNTLTCVIRYSSKINENTTATFNNENYRVKNYENLKFENRFLRLTLVKY